jgi:hypothetical protein
LGFFARVICFAVFWVHLIIFFHLTSS